MTDQPQAAPTTPPTATPKKTRQGRSPAFPFIPLQKALERTDAFRLAEGGRPKHFAPVAAACQTWGMGVKTGQAIQTVAALNHFGLVEFEGTGEKRAMRPTDTAFKILLDKQPLSPERDALIKKVAIAPTIHKELWDKWYANLPSDPTLETYLVRDRGFSDGGARDLMAEYKATIAFAKLTEADTVAPIEHDDGSTNDVPLDIGIGDLVQAKIGGVLAFPKPMRVRAVQGGWVFVDEYEAGVKMENVELIEKGKGVEAVASNAPRLPLPKKEDQQLPPDPGTRVLRFALTEGDVTVSFPENLSADSVEDLDGFWQVFMKRARREAALR